MGLNNAGFSQANVQAQRGCAALSRSVRWSAGLGMVLCHGGKCPGKPKVGAGETAHNSGQADWVHSEIASSIWRGPKAAISVMETPIRKTVQGMKEPMPSARS